jgi:DNA-directed RNA polymerase specialized sigma24 family protein
MTAEDPGSVTEWLPRFEAGDPEAVRFVWNRYFEMMVLLARLKLAGLQDRGRDAEDVALSAFNALCRAKGRTLTPCLRDRDELWTLLARSTRNRVLNLRRDAARQKRQPTGFIQRSLQSLSRQAHRRLSPPTPQETAEFADWMEYMFTQLDRRDTSGKLRTAARLKLEGYTDSEIAAQQSCSRKTVSTRMALIRAIWRELAES